MKDLLKNIIKFLKLNHFLIITRIWIDLPLKSFAGFPIRLATYFSDYFDYTKKCELKSMLNMENIFPCVFDKTETTPVEPVYFYQNCWAASKIFSVHPGKHVDIGSSLKTIGIISQFVKTDMVDIRPTLCANISETLPNP